jgi:hypothetical protein
MAGVLIATVVALVAVVWIIVYSLREHTAKRERIDDALEGERIPTLEYDVPTGQDPSAILAALERAGYTATVDSHHAHQQVLVACPGGADRERGHVRTVIASATVTTPDGDVPLEPDVRFGDE